MLRASDPHLTETVGWAWHAWSLPSQAAKPALARHRAPTALWVLGVGAGLGAIVLFAGFLIFVSALARQERAPTDRADGIVALTGGAQRIGDAIDLLAGGYGRRLLITGVNERTSRDEIARLNPTQRALIACCVDLDYRARNTIGNAIETRRWMRAHRFSTVAVVTSNYHMPRTLVELVHALQDSDRVLPHPVVTDAFDADRWWRSPPAARLVASEYVKFLASWVRTRFEADPERSRAAILIGRGKPVKMVAEPLAARDLD
ncbi:YdcF family protein [Methylobacterium sp. J-030]|uniref:YdcF family protein n=1 Tax=Methylobacterium sp. J-030 TaxID=2836627 RepID=UPI001FB93074|nr:YdcF family protein [Methylobacterium sp. J-030]MCJ2069646.1 YdcF family protein [Methylobacterium sp. J-030]